MISCLNRHAICLFLVIIMMIESCHAASPKETLVQRFDDGSEMITEMIRDYLVS